MKSLTFLLAEANTPYRQILHQMIATHPNWSVVAETGDGAEAARLAGKHLPDVVLMDVNLPGTNGIETTRRIRLISPGTCVIVLSGYHDEEFHRASLQAGANHYLNKEDVNDESLARLIAVLCPKAEQAEHQETSRTE
jgi:NarL family two-component system response regulator LiaR